MSAERSSARSAPTNIGMHKNDASSSSSFDHVAYFHSFVSRHGGVALVFVRATGHVSLAEHACCGGLFPSCINVPDLIFNYRARTKTSYRQNGHAAKHFD